jgi:metal-responsive CopG/Arc/MetJ family transcriptional regulator
MLTERVELRVPKDLLVRLDAWRRLQDDLPSRSEAIRRLIELGLEDAPAKVARKERQ